MVLGSTVRNKQLSLQEHSRISQAAHRGRDGHNIEYRLDTDTEVI